MKAARTNLLNLFLKITAIFTISFSYAFDRWHLFYTLSELAKFIISFETSLHSIIRYRFGHGLDYRLPAYYSYTSSAGFLQASTGSSAVSEVMESFTKPVLVLITEADIIDVFLEITLSQTPKCHSQVWVGTDFAVFSDNTRFWYHLRYSERHFICNAL